MSIEQFLPEPIRSRYAVKLLGVSLLVVFAITALGSVAVFDIADSVRDEQLDSMRANAELEANALAQWIDGKQQTVRVLSNHRGLDPADPARTAAVLDAELTDLSEEAATLSLVERTPERFSEGVNETIVASTEATHVGRPLSVTDVNWNPSVGYNFEGEDDVILSWVYTAGDEPFVAVASPTPDGGHVLVAEYRTSVRAESFTSVIDGTKTQVLGGFTSFVLFDENESNVITEYEGDAENTTIGSRILATEPTAELNGSVLTDTSVKGYHSVPGPAVDWVVVKEAPRSSALAVSDSVRTDLAVLLGVTLLGFLSIGVVIQRGPIRSIQRLATQADAIAEGRLDVEIEDAGRSDEIGQLRTAFRNTKAYVETVAGQADALSQRAFDDEAFEADVPGQLGRSIETMRADLQQFITDLEAERERYSTLVEQSNDGIAVVTDGRYVFVNDRLTDITGYDRDALLGMEYDEVVVGDHSEPMRERVSRLFDDDGGSIQSELDIETRTGHRRHVEIAGSEIEHDGEPAVLVNVRDTTERRRREQRLEVFNRILRHNLRNQLDVIDSHAERLDALTDGDHAERVLAATDRLAAIGNRARRIDRLMSSDRPPTSVDLAEVVETTLERVGADAAGVTVTTDLPGSADLRTDAETLESALESALDNAVRYADSAVEVTVEPVPTGYAVVVSDDGPGIPDHELDALEAGTETELRHSQGLGLWQLKWSVEKLNGTLSFDTEAGTTVRITVPDLGDDEA